MAGDPEFAYQLFPNVSFGSIKHVALLRDNRDQVWKGEADVGTEFVYSLARQDGHGRVYYLYAHGNNGQRLPDPHVFRMPGRVQEKEEDPAPGTPAGPASLFADPHYQYELLSQREDRADARNHSLQMAEVEERRVHSYVELALRQQEAHNRQTEALLTQRGQDLQVFQASAMQQASEISRLRAEAFQEADRLTRSMTEQVSSLSENLQRTQLDLMQRLLAAERRADTAESNALRAELAAQMQLMQATHEHTLALAKLRGRKSDDPSEHPAVQEARAKLELAKVRQQIAEVDTDDDDEGSLIGSTLASIAERFADHVEDVGFDGLFENSDRGNKSRPGRSLSEDEIVE